MATFPRPQRRIAAGCNRSLELAVATRSLTLEFLGGPGPLLIHGPGDRFPPHG